QPHQFILMARLPAGPKEPQNLQSKLRSPQGTKVVPAHPEAKQNSARSVPPPKPVQPLSAPYLTCGSGDARLEHASTQSGHNRICFDAERTQPKGEPPLPAPTQLTGRCFASSWSKPRYVASHLKLLIVDTAIRCRNIISRLSCP